ncbi:MAG: site-specific DNA-methyltransferase [Prevotellaceae bacterium]|nr:site-specific DNA-methyltransferase [Prevotellaceae bacterium]
MDKLRMQSTNGVQENIEKIQQLFPDCVTETIDERTGELVRKVDFEKLQQNLSDVIISGREERYQFTWPDKKKAILLANSPVNAALRPCREESVDFDNTQNLYIEGDNLDVLKCLKETYLHKVKMIYIDLPYNTGNDFVYEDDFAESSAEYLANSGQFDEQGNRLVTNTESNGRFHTDWLNMIYPRLKVARDLLADDGVIFISIDDNEQENLKRVCDEIFGESNFVACFIWKSRQNKDNRNITGVSIDSEYILCYSKKSGDRVFKGTERKTEQYKNPDNDPRGPWTSANMVGLATKDARPNLHYNLINPQDGINYGCPEKGWRYDKNSMTKLIESERVLWPDTPQGRPRRKVFLSELSDDNLPGFSSIIENGIFTNTATKEIHALLDGHWFDFPKPSLLVKDFLQQTTLSDSIILDFFSGSATTAHAVMQLNAEDGGNRKFIMVQLPEVTDEKSEAYKTGYKNICEIGKERIRRAGKKIKEDSSLTTQDLDTGFRVLKLDSSNMEDIYYTPKDINQADLFSLVDNVKPDRTAEDLLFQVMLELGATLDSKIATEVVAGKTIYNVADGYLVACFDKNVTDEVVTAIAKMHPLYAVLRDTSMANDSTATNFEQIFKTYSPDTVTKIL